MSLLPGRFYLDNFFDDLLDERRNNAMKCDIYEMLRWMYQDLTKMIYQST